MKIKDFMFGCGILGSAIAFPTVAKSIEMNFRSHWLKNLHATNNDR